MVKKIEISLEHYTALWGISLSALGLFYGSKVMKPTNRKLLKRELIGAYKAGVWNQTTVESWGKKIMKGVK